MDEFRDETIKCVDCGENFIWTVKEQRFFKERNLKNKPTRCIECRKKRREALKSEGELIDIQCSQCGLRATTPFTDAQKKELYCSSCFENLKKSILGEGKEKERTEDKEESVKKAER